MIIRKILSLLWNTVHSIPVNRDKVLFLFIYLALLAKIVYICTAFIGALAHLARALDWQSKGDRFESDMLHEILTPHAEMCGDFYFNQNI